MKPIERTKESMDSLIDRTRDVVVGIADSAERGVEATAKQAVEKAHRAGDHVRGGAETASRGAHRGVESAAKVIDQGYKRASGDLSRVKAAARDYVAENPGRTLLLTASAGFALGMLMRRRSAAAVLGPPSPE
jgi:ElaB/YqjD/DUF883 family membrane-anchored ribosome-binding protein